MLSDLVEFKETIMVIKFMGPAVFAFPMDGQAISFTHLITHSRCPEIASSSLEDLCAIFPFGEIFQLQIEPEDPEQASPVILAKLEELTQLNSTIAFRFAIQQYDEYLSPYLQGLLQSRLG